MEVGKSRFVAFMCIFLSKDNSYCDEVLIIGFGISFHGR